MGDIIGSVVDYVAPLAADYFTGNWTGMVGDATGGDTGGWGSTYDTITGGGLSGSDPAPNTGTPGSGMTYGNNNLGGMGPMTGTDPNWGFTADPNSTPDMPQVTAAAQSGGFDLGKMASGALDWLGTGNNLQKVISGAGGLAAFFQANGAQKTTPTDQVTAQYQAMSNLLHQPKIINGQSVDLYGSINGIVPSAKNQIAYTGDPLKYGQPGQGGEHQFFDKSNPLQDIPGGMIAPSATGANQPNDHGYIPPTTPVVAAPTTQTSASTVPVIPRQTGLPTFYGPNAVNTIAPKAYKNGGNVQTKLGIIPPSPKGYVQGAGTGQSDSIHAKLSDGEYVMDADVVSALGNGSNKAGAAALDQMRANVRKHNRSTDTGKIPPPAKAPQAYLKGRK